MGARALKRQSMAEADVAALQTQHVRYAGRDQTVPGPWEQASSPTTAQAGAQSCVPVSLRFTLMEAPAEWCWPIRTDK